MFVTFRKLFRSSPEVVGATHRRRARQQQWRKQARPQWERIYRLRPAPVARMPIICPNCGNRAWHCACA